MKRVLLTGATGFVGLPTARALLDAGCEVICTLRPGTLDKLEGIAVETLECDDIFAQSADWWAKACQGVDTVIHLAWYAEPGKYLPSEKNLDCLAGTLALAKGAAQAGVRRFVGVGTCFEYDLSDGHLSVDNTAIAPLTPYAAAKAATNTMLQSWFRQQGISYLWARLFYLYGAREDARRLVPYLHAQMQAGQPADLTSGTAVRDYMDVDDAAKLLVQEALGDRVGATNICSGQGVTIRELAEQIADQYDRRDLLNFGARPDNLTDPPIVVGLRDQPAQRGAR
ncbi:dTDP-glucose 4,6-dehydratase [Phaeobacter sp. CECT 5382]|uniref:NAD-dependent epimerase/dehydratase family protein n=1 Tax=Phaeobacter sp. CECT 5382 TaxID=1712645 RepID=UPI0006D99F03|nr:NAD(P)-dependent oxidoreductase [Phaeobacter sp. CECT 5382]CUH87151.1 dTDP-glucose 4,6-dehydratase [Phaeobacter sp. CECT 5382]